MLCDFPLGREKKSEKKKKISILMGGCTVFVTVAEYTTYLLGLSRASPPHPSPPIDPIPNAMIHPIPSVALGMSK